MKLGEIIDKLINIEKVECSEDAVTVEFSNSLKVVYAGNGPDLMGVGEINIDDISFEIK